MARGKIRKSDLETARVESYEDGMSEISWVVILSDMMMLLLTFFVMLFSIVSPDAEKLAEILEEVGDALGGRSIVEKKKKEDPMEKAKENIEKVIVDNNLVNDVELTSDARGIVLFSRGDFFFKSGTSELLPDTKIFLKKVASIIKTLPFVVLVEGHTDDVPISTPQFPTNWELSTARAARVVRYFVETSKLDPKMFIVAGYGEFKPRFSPTPENRPRNRRVEIVILRGKLK